MHYSASRGKNMQQTCASDSSCVLCCVVWIHICTSNNQSL